MFDFLLEYLDDFEKELLDEIISNYQDSSSRLRLCILAFSLRGLFENFELRLAPDDKVCEALWYEIPENSQDNRPVTRTQRYKYLIQGAYDDFFIKHILKFEDVDEYAKKLNGIMSNFSKYTHIKKKFLNLTKEECHEFLIKSEESLREFFNVFKESFKVLESYLQEFMLDIVTDEFVSSTIEEIDDFATHNYLEYADIESIDFKQFPQFPFSCQESTFEITVSGNLETSHEVGSSSDFRNGDGLSWKGSFPFELDYKFMIPFDTENFKLKTKIEDTPKEDLEKKKEQYLKAINETFSNTRRSVDTDLQHQQFYLD